MSERNPLKSIHDPKHIEIQLQKADPTKPIIGIALGAGAARGWAHIGVLRALNEAGIYPQIITGTSMGAVVGGCYAAGKLAGIESFARSLDKNSMYGLMDVSLKGSGLVGGGQLERLLTLRFGDKQIENLGLKFAAIATEFKTGNEVWLTSGHLVTAMRASYSIPGLFEPVKIGARWLFDGALVNPVPVTTARAMGAEIVIAISLNYAAGNHGGVVPQAHAEKPVQQTKPSVKEGIFSPMLSIATNLGERLFKSGAEDKPGIGSIMVDAINIMQDRVARARMAGDPADLIVSPKLSDIGLFDFHRADEAIKAGSLAVNRMLPDITEAIASLTQSA